MWRWSVLKGQLKHTQVKVVLWLAVRVLWLLLYVRAVYAYFRGGLTSWWHIGPAVAAQMHGVHKHYETKVKLEEHLNNPTTQKIMGKAEEKRRRKQARNLRLLPPVMTEAELAAEIAQAKAEEEVDEPA